MPGRLPGEVPNFEKGKWTSGLGKQLTEFLVRLRFGMGGLQGPPETPSTIKAGDVSSTGVSQAPMPSDAVHGVSTGAPSVYVAMGGAFAEGTGTTLMRASATLVVSDDVEVMDWINL